MAEAGGSGGRTETCTVAKHVEIPLDLFGEASDPPSVRPWGDRFVLLSSAPLTQTRMADLAVVSWQGVDIQNELSLKGLCPDDVCTNVLGVSVLATDASNPQLLLADEGSAVSMPSYLLHAKAWDTSRSDPADTELFDAPIAAITTRAAMQSSRDATRALFAIGNIDEPTVQAIELGPDAEVIAPVTTLTLSGAPWDCLAIVPTRGAGALSAVVKTEGGTEVTWHLRELDAGADSVFETMATVPVSDALGYTDCPTVVDGPDGFHAQWVNAYGNSVVASVERDADPAAAPTLLRFDVSPGVLAGAMSAELWFQGFVSDDRRGFVRLRDDGSPGGPPITLPVLPESSDEHRRALPTVLGTEGDAAFVAYELEDARVLEQIRCR